MPEIKFYMVYIALFVLTMAIMYFSFKRKDKKAQMPVKYIFFDTEVTVRDDWNTIASINRIDGDIIVTPEFLGFRIEEKDFLISQLLFLRENDGNLFDADLRALEKITFKYPEIGKQHWVMFMTRLFKKHMTLESAKRIDSISLSEIKTKTHGIIAP